MLAGVAVLLCVVVALLARGGGPTPVPAPMTSSAPSAVTAEEDARLARLFSDKATGVQVEGRGEVARLLADDEEGGRHQRFILRLASGQTLLVAHNIDVAPRLDGLAVGEEVRFFGEYVYTEAGGTIHWTHHDPGGTHVAGWLEWNGRRYG